MKSSAQSSPVVHRICEAESELNFEVFILAWPEMFSWQQIGAQRDGDYLGKHTAAIHRLKKAHTGAFKLQRKLRFSHFVGGCRPRFLSIGRVRPGIDSCCQKDVRKLLLTNQATNCTSLQTL